MSVKSTSTVAVIPIRGHEFRPMSGGLMVHTYMIYMTKIDNNIRDVGAVEYVTD